MSWNQLLRWRKDRARQARIYNFSTVAGSRGDWLRRCNNGVALRTFRHIKESVP